MKAAALARLLRHWPQCFRAVLVFFLGLTGCASLHSMSTPTSRSMISADLPPAQDLLQTLESRRQAITSLRGLARVVYKDSQEKGTAKQAIAVAEPDRFRWEFFSPIGVAALVTSNGKMLSTYFPNEKVLYRGGATAENVARFTRVALSPREIVGLLLSVPVLPTLDHTCIVRMDASQGWYHLYCQGVNEDGVALWFEPQPLRLRRVELYAGNGQATKRLDLADYRPVGGLTFPFEVALSDFQSHQQASIFYERVELNAHPADSIFTLASISGVREIDADAFNP